MATNSRPVKLPTISHLPKCDYDPDSTVQTPTKLTSIASRAHPTSKAIPAQNIHDIPYNTPCFQFHPRNNTVKFTINKFGVAFVALDRPTKRNSVTLEMIADLYDIIQHLRRISDYVVAIVLLSSSADIFCAGLDVASVAGNPAKMKLVVTQYNPTYTSFEQYTTTPQHTTTSSTSSRKPTAAPNMLLHPHSLSKVNEMLPFPPITRPVSSSAHITSHNLIQHICVGWQLLPVPVIALVNGFCLGAGLQLALGADIRIGSLQTTCSILEGKWGMIPDMGISLLARGVIAEDTLRMLTLTSEFVSGPDLLRVGLLTEQYNDYTACCTRVNTILTNLVFKPPETVHAMKALFTTTKTPIMSSNETQAHFFMNDTQLTAQQRVALSYVQSTLHQEHVLQTQILSSYNQQELVRATMEQRLPQYLVSSYNTPNGMSFTRPNENASARL